MTKDNDGVCKSCENLADKVERMRQRVAELEESERRWIERGNYWTDEAAKLNAELVALKAEQGDPVGKIVAATGSLMDAAVIQWISEYRPAIGDLLYTIPPTCFTAADMAEAEANAVKIEREECAKICDCYTVDDDGANDDARRCAKGIRSRNDA